jgi:hypothetical protein
MCVPEKSRDGDGLYRRLVRSLQSGLSRKNREIRACFAYFGRAGGSSLQFRLRGGRSGIRTHVTLSSTAALQVAALNHSATSAHAVRLEHQHKRSIILIYTPAKDTTAFVRGRAIAQNRQKVLLFEWTAQPAARGLVPLNPYGVYCQPCLHRSIDRLQVVFDLS